MKAAVFAVLMLVPGAAWAANPVVQADGRICYNAECEGVYDTPQKQCEPAKHAKVPTFRDGNYANARSSLMANGWQPLPNPEPVYENEQWAVDAGFTEVEACAGSADVCRFAFQDKHRTILVVLRHHDSVNAYFPCN